MAARATSVVLSLLVAVFQVSSLSPPVILTSGTVRGTVLDVSGTQVNAYLGIPYAKPPVGELRFKPPVPPDPWQGVYNATVLARDCYQELQDNEEDNRSEDCLYLNVWQSPSQPHDGAVMVWIHGGGFIVGSATKWGLAGQFLAATEHLLVVSMNYRLGALGFLALGTDDAPGNMGLLDQQLALQWVQDNIERFGGNPDRVTIFGTSAGTPMILGPRRGHPTTRRTSLISCWTHSRSELRSGPGPGLVPSGGSTSGNCRNKQMLAAPPPPFPPSSCSSVVSPVFFFSLSD
ncbi:type-B carboxylesterase lipase [Branchiostoma belcheri]|nr:type-B carboxylesterase lipase [Branchiostoma belcheri]